MDVLSRIGVDTAGREPSEVWHACEEPALGRMVSGVHVVEEALRTRDPLLISARLSLILTQNPTSSFAKRYDALFETFA